MSRKLDAAIAEALGYEVLTKEELMHKKFGYTNVYGLSDTERKEKGIIGKGPLPHYSTDGNAMLELDREMRERGYRLDYRCIGDNEFEVGYFRISETSLERYCAENNEILARAKAAYKALTGEEWEEAEDED